MESDSHIMIKFLLRAFRSHLGGWLRDPKMREVNPQVPALENERAVKAGHRVRVN